jgi:hypothetical protein
MWRHTLYPPRTTGPFPFPQNSLRDNISPHSLNTVTVFYFLIWNAACNWLSPASYLRSLQRLQFYYFFTYQICHCRCLTRLYLMKFTNNFFLWGLRFMKCLFELVPFKCQTIPLSGSRSPVPVDKAPVTESWRHKHISSTGNIRKSDWSLANTGPSPNLLRGIHSHFQASEKSKTTGGMRL